MSFGRGHDTRINASEIPPCSSSRVMFMFHNKNIDIIFPVENLMKQEFEGNQNVLMWMKTHFVSSRLLKYVERILNKHAFGYKYGLV